LGLIGREFAFVENYKNSPKFWASFFYGKSYVGNDFTKNGMAFTWAIFQKPHLVT
jgi:hypothetical protein